MKVAFHKGGNRVGDKLIKWWDDGLYSHCEIVFSDGLWASASMMDGSQVRGKRIKPTEGSWDYLILPDEYELAARNFFNRTEGTAYDLLGVVRFVVAPYRGQGSKYWCSEWVAEAVGLKEPWRYGPNGLANVLRILIESKHTNVCLSTNKLCSA